MGKIVAPLIEWPWQRLRGWKYAIYVPFIIKAYSTNYLGGYDVDNWCMHMIILSSIRFVVGQLWSTFSRLHCISKKYQINRAGVEFEQVDREFNTDNHIIFQALVATVAHTWLPGFRNLPLWNARGLLVLLLLHTGPVELLYYCFHRALHTEFLFPIYHSHHHASDRPEPSTSGLSTFAEQILQTSLMGVALIGTGFLGGASISMLYVYCLGFDFLKNMIHSNVEIIPASIFHALPFLRHLVITPSYHSLHHIEQKSNFCLFLPLYDYLGRTVDNKTVKLHDFLRMGREEKAPDFVFLAHCIDVLSSLHVSFCIRTLAAHPYAPKWYLWPFWPVIIPFILALWGFGHVFVAYKYVLDSVVAQTWVVPRYGFQYFIPVASCLDGINDLIEEAILAADRMGVKVVSLAALNKNEALNGGGRLFVDKHPNLRVRVVHGNTLTAACIIRCLPKDETEVFMTGATSKLGRAIALYLCQRKVRVLMLTNAPDRFNAIVKEAPQKFRHYLIRVTKYQAGKNCKTWIMGKWIKNKDQDWAPAGTHFHQFVVPPVPDLRKDCTYGKLAAMRLPTQAKGISTCEMTCDRGVVHACHAGGLIHALEGWQHHEVGTVDVNRIDIVWAAAMKHGFSPVNHIDIGASYNKINDKKFI